jgi:hypothetical protein
MCSCIHTYAKRFGTDFEPGTQIYAMPDLLEHLNHVERAFFAGVSTPIRPGSY